MRLSMFARLGRSGRRLVWGGALTGLLLAAGTTAIGDVSPEAKRGGSQSDSFSLFAGPTVQLRGNQLQCGLNSIGAVCTDVFDSPTGGGGFWPVGSPNQYIFNTGLQVAGVVGPDGGPWASDTTATLFFDPLGTNQHGTALTDIYDSLNPDDAANWPPEAKILDPALYQPVLLGRDAASQQDSWVQYWDGNPNRISGRIHPLGLLVTQRSLAWNYPAGNESVIYFTYDFENVTQSTDFQQLNETQFFGGDNLLPDDGYTIVEMYAAFATDMDVTLNATDNFSTAILPFDLGLSYHGGFDAPNFSYTPDLFFPPFFVDAPGIVGVKYLKSPVSPATGEEVGLTLFGNTLNPSAGAGVFLDAGNAKQTWRYLSGKLDPNQGDVACNVVPEVETGNPDTTQRSVCYVFQSAADTRFYQASGPFEMAAGDKATIVVAYIIAPTVETMPDGTPSGIIAQGDKNANPPGDPSFHPGFPSARGCTPADIIDNNPGNCLDFRTDNPVKSIEKGAGWFQYTGPQPSGRMGGVLEGPDNKIDQFQVEVVPSSLLGRALVAQSIFDSKFLLGFAPDPPAFYLVPDDNFVTVIWDPSATEELGDPFFVVANDPLSPLFNPNYRQFDVEGYRVWRGTDPGDLTLLSQFDYAKTSFPDFTCETVLPDSTVGTTRDGVAVVGFAGGETCAGVYPDSPVQEYGINGTLFFNNGSDGGLPGLGVARLVDLSALGVSLTHAIVDDTDAGATSPLTNSGVPFAFSDGGVTNNFTYFYAVTAFDVNSQASGPHSLRSARVSQSTVPRAANSALQAGFDADVIISGDDGVPLDLTGPTIAPDVDTGIFPGPQNPTNSLELLISPPPAEVASLLSAGQLTGVFDSVTAEDVTFGCADGGNSRGACLQVYMTFDNGLEVTSTRLEVTRTVYDGFGEAATITAALGAGAYPFDGDALVNLGIPADAGSGVAAGLEGTYDMTISDPAFVGQRIRRFPTGRYQPGGNRWFDGTENDTPDPTRFIGAGHIDGIDSVWAPIHHTHRFAGDPNGSGDTGGYPASGNMQCFGYYLAILARSADFQVTWGAGGAVTVRDITHNVPVDFKDSPQMSYGFMNTDGNANGVIDWQDFDYLDVIRTSSLRSSEGFCEFFDAGVTNPARSVLQQTATIQPVSLEGVSPLAGPDPMPALGNGFALYINGERYIFLTDNLPAEGTVWTYRTYGGRIRADDALTDDPSDYEIRGGSGTHRPPAIPNMVFLLDVKEAGISQVEPFDLAEVHTVPDPYLATSQYDLSPTTKQLMFVNLPPKATIRIYTLTGILVDIVNHDDSSGGGREVWDIRNRNNQFVASGVYFFHVVDADGAEHVGKFTIVNFGGQN